MKIKRAILLLAVVSLLITIPTFGAKEYGDLDPPDIWIAWLTYGVDTGVDWDDVIGAVKYSVDIEGLAIFNDGDLVDGDGDGDPLDPEILEVGVSFGTSDRTDGGEMGDSDLTITLDELAAAIAAELGIPVEDVLALDETVYKVKALAPGKDKGRQNNEFDSIEPLWLIDF